MRRLRATLVPVLCASMLLGALPTTQASAAPAPRPGITASNSDGITLVRDRRGRGHRRHRHRRGGGGGWGPAGIVGAIIAGTIIAAAIQEGRADEDDMERCAERYRSFDWETGTYINRYGEERVCPYLR
jgi:BA14K-like protein